MMIFLDTANLDELRLDTLIGHPLAGRGLDRFPKDCRKVYRETGL